MSRFTAKARPVDMLFGHGRVSAINNDRCVAKPIGCEGDAGFSDMTDKELAEYQISGLCVKCQREIFGV